MTSKSLLLTLLMLLSPRVLWAADYFGNPSNYVQQLTMLQAGDRLLLEPGDYRDCLRLDGLHGSEFLPIVIEGPDLSTPARFLGSNCLNNNPPYGSTMVRIQDSSHLVLRNLELDAENLAVVGVQAGYSWPAVHHVTLDGLYIHDNDLSPQITAISCFTTAWNWKIQNNRLERVGLGMYLGNSDGSDPFISGLIEYNLIVNPQGYGIQIKHQNGRSLQPGLPSGDSVTTIRHNVIIKASNASQGNAARPNLLVGHFPRTGIGQNDRYEIYGNFLFENESNTEPLFQGEGNLAFHDNVLFSSFDGPGVWIAPHNDVPKDVVIYRNTIVTRGWGVVVMGGDTAFRQRVIGNAVYSSSLMATDVEHNISASFSDAANVFVNTSATLGQLDLYPLAGALSSNVVDYSEFANHQDWDKDFNGQSRVGARRGAYEGSGANLGWPLSASIKSRSGISPPMDVDAGILDAGEFIDSGVSMDIGLDAEIRDSSGSENMQDAGWVPVDAATEQDAGAQPGRQISSTRSSEMEESCSCRASYRGLRADMFLLSFVVACLLGRRRRSSYGVTSIK